MLKINIIDINVIPNADHLGIWKKSLTLPVIVQRAIAMIIDAKKSIRISFNLHKINIERTNAEIDRNVVVFKLLI